jgi:hypothetical protein
VHRHPYPVGQALGIEVMKFLYVSGPSAFRDLRKADLPSVDSFKTHLGELAQDHLPLATVDVVVIKGENPAAPVDDFA